MLPNVLEEQNVRHYIPSSQPQVKINFYQVSSKGVTIQPRVIEVSKTKHEANNTNIFPTRNLLSKPIDKLIEEANDKLKAIHNDDSVEITEDKGVEEMQDVEKFKSELWVDKYNPKNFIDLITDERINREFLTWMKSWDKIVFPKKQKPRQAFLFYNSTPSFSVLYIIKSVE